MPEDESQPRARAFALHLLAIASTALALLAIVLCSNRLPDMECIIYGHTNLTHFGSDLHNEFSAQLGWIWLFNGSTVQVQGRMGSKHGGFLKEVVVGSTGLNGGVLHITSENTTWYPPSGEEQLITSGMVNGTVKVEVTPVGGEIKDTVLTTVEDFTLKVDRWSTDHYMDLQFNGILNYMNMELVNPLESSYTGLCVNAAFSSVSEADNLATPHTTVKGYDEVVAAA